MPGLASSRWAPKSPQPATPQPAAAQPSPVSWQKEYLQPVVPTTTTPTQAAPASPAPSSKAVAPPSQQPAAPAKEPAPPRSGGLMASKHATAHSSHVPVPVAKKATNGRLPPPALPKEQSYTLPPWAGLSKDEYYGLVQRCAGRTTTESEWKALAEGVKDARVAGTWGADWRVKG